MKVYVIKDKQTQEYQTVVMDFISDIRQSDIFIDYEVALAYCPSDCEVVECELIEKTEFADHDKQVRKEVVKQVLDFIEEHKPYYFEQRDYYGAEYIFFNRSNLEKDILDQIQGETKWEN